MENNHNSKLQLANETHEEEIANIRTKHDGVIQSVKGNVNATIEEHESLIKTIKSEHQEVRERASEPFEHPQGQPQWPSNTP